MRPGPRGAAWRGTPVREPAHPRPPGADPAPPGPATDRGGPEVPAPDARPSAGAGDRAAGLAGLESAPVTPEPLRLVVRLDKRGRTFRGWGCGWCSGR